MATLPEAIKSVRTYVVDRFSECQILWKGDGERLLPDTPGAFISCRFVFDGSEVISLGAGRGLNRNRGKCILRAYVCLPAGQGDEALALLVESFSVVLRSVATEDFIITSVQPFSDESTDESGSYDVATVEAAFTHDYFG